MFFIINARVVVQDKSTNTSEVFTYIYNPQEAYKFFAIDDTDTNNRHSSLAWIFLIIGLMIIIILIVFLVFVYKKLQVTKNKLIYEMSDVRNVTDINKGDYASQNHAIQFQYEKKEEPSIPKLDYKGFDDEK